MIEEIYKEFKKNVYKASKDPFIRTALRRAVKSFRSARDDALKAFPEVEKKRKLLQERKEYSLLNVEELIERTKKSVERQHGNFYFAKTEDDVKRILSDIIGTGKTIVKGKSMTTEELEINKLLEEKGNSVFETDLGEFIVQLLKTRPMHILAPAVNVPREKVAEAFSKLGGKELPPDIPKLTLFAREFLRDKYFSADYGISGANAIVAETGSIFLIENEGNIRFVTNAPPVHIVIAGIEKIIPTMEDGMLFLDVVQRYAGYFVTSYISIISGPSKTGDIEKTVVYGAHGPKELHIILVDNGRSEMIKDPVFRKALYCVRCGACMYECPVYPITTGYWGHRYMGGIGIPWTAFVAGGLEIASPMAFACTLCGRCVKYCPMEIDTPIIVERLREIMKEKGYLPKYVEDLANNVIQKGKPY